MYIYIYICITRAYNLIAVNVYPHSSVKVIGYFSKTLQIVTQSCHRSYDHHLCVAVCCSVLQCVAACCSVLQQVESLHNLVVAPMTITY